MSHLLWCPQYRMDISLLYPHHYHRRQVLLLLLYWHRSSETKEAYWASDARDRRTTWDSFMLRPEELNSFNALLWEHWKQKEMNVSSCWPSFLELNSLCRGWTKSPEDRQHGISANLGVQRPCLLLQLWVMTEWPSAPLEVSVFLPRECYWRQFPGRSLAFEDSV